MIPAALKKLRKERNLKQYQMAELLGLNVSQYNAYEVGRRGVKPEALWEFSKVLNVPVTVFFNDNFYNSENLEEESNEVS